MLPWETIASTRTPDGVDLTLARRGDEYVVRANGRALMSSAAHHSEDSLARLAWDRGPAISTVLIGGLGLGFTLRAVLDRLPKTGRVVVLELSDALIEWNRTHVKHLAHSPLEDPRVELVKGDVFRHLTRSSGTYDAVLLDVDNGPSALAHLANDQLYAEAGIYCCQSALKGVGVLTVWSAGPDVKYLERLQRAGFDARGLTVTARPEGGHRHMVFVAVKKPPTFRRERHERGDRAQKRRR